MAYQAEQVQQIIEQLRQHYRDVAKNRDMRAQFAQDPQRFNKNCLVLDDLLLDWSKCSVDEQVLDLLQQLAKAADVEGRRDAMFAGETINITENRPVLHVALRAPRDQKFMVSEHNVVEDVYQVLERMETFCNLIREGQLRGYDGRPFSDIVNIGIGGSDLGPAMVYQALTPYAQGPQCHYISNVDGAHIADTLGKLDPATTLIIVASKTFTTVETMSNARIARQWVVSKLGEDAVNTHFVAVSSAMDKVADFGIGDDRIFDFWNWVGGRYSVWSAIGLSVMLAIGPEQFYQFLAGAHAMDEHFRNAPIKANMPMMLGLLGFWHRNGCGYGSRAVVPYEQRLQKLPAYLQQLDMESNGKSVNLDGEAVQNPTGPVVWGEAGTNGQHAFFQLLHQGTDIIPVEFIASVNGHEPQLQHQHNLLLANCLAQAEALMKGQTLEEVRAKMASAGMDEPTIDALSPHQVFPGNRPSIMIMQDLLTPYALGRLLALYEHRVFVEGCLMHVNSFDQWGVELGKVLAKKLAPMLNDGQEDQDHDSSTLGLVAHILAR